MSVMDQLVGSALMRKMNKQDLDSAISNVAASTYNKAQYDDWYNNMSN